MKKIKISFLSLWYNEKQLLNMLKESTPNNDGIWENIEGTDNLEKCDYIILFDGLKKDYKINWNKTILFETEPTRKIYFSFKDKALLHFDYKNCYCLLSWWIKKTFKELETLPYIDKNLGISTIITNKYKLPGHKKRVNFIKKLALSYPKLIDIFGKNLNALQLGKSYKGPLINNGICKFNGLYPYKYSIVCENISHKNYFSEKIRDSFLCWTLPLYWGCPNIFEFFPSESFFWLNIDNLKRIHDIKKISNLKITEKQKNAMRESRYLVMYKYNIWPTIHRILKGEQIL